MGACLAFSWFAFGVAVLTLLLLAARIAAAVHGRPVSGSPVIAVAVPLVWVVIGVGLRRFARGLAASRGGS